MKAELDRFVRISNGARILSWIVLALHMAYAIWAILVEIQTGTFGFRNSLISFFPFLVMLASAVTSFVLLQAIYSGSPILIEILKKTENP